MRLIDADALKTELLRMNFYPALVKAAIDRITTVDAAPVVHGEWVVCGDGDNVPWLCSHCGKTTAHKYKTMYGKYCPNCGAKMMEGDSENDT